MARAGAAVVAGQGLRPLAAMYAGRGYIEIGGPRTPAAAMYTTNFYTSQPGYTGALRTAHAKRGMANAIGPQAAAAQNIQQAVAKLTYV